MKSSTIKLIVAGTAVALTLTGFVYAKSGGEKPNDNRDQKQFTTDNSGGFEKKEKTHLTEEQKAALIEKAKTNLAAKLADGTITQAQYDAAIADLAAGKLPMGNGFGKGQKPQMTEEQKAALIEKMKTDLAAKLADGSITQAQYDTAIADLAAGKLPMGCEFGMGQRPQMTDEQKAACIEKAKTDLAAKLADGTITQAQYDTAIADLAAGKLPMGRGFGMGQRPQMTDEQKAALVEKAKTDLAAKLADGTITQAQYDTAIADIEAGKLPMMGRGFNMGKRPQMTDEQKAALIEKAKTNLAAKLADGTITQAQYDKAIANLNEGKLSMMGKGGRGEKGNSNHQAKPFENRNGESSNTAKA